MIVRRQRRLKRPGLRRGASSSKPAAVVLAAALALALAPAEAGASRSVQVGVRGSITVYDLDTRQAVATFQTGEGGFLNDLVVTGLGDVYVTDSFRPTLWHVTAEQVPAGSGTPQALDVSAIPFEAGQFNLNGIVAKGSRRLVVVDFYSGKLFPRVSGFSG